MYSIPYFIDIEINILINTCIYIFFKNRAYEYDMKWYWFAKNQAEEKVESMSHQYCQSTYMTHLKDNVIVYDRYVPK